ncbi:hypothetical protein ES705_42028 [subsurface metagenome]
MYDFFRRGFHGKANGAGGTYGTARITIYTFGTFPIFFGIGPCLSLAVNGAEPAIDTFLRVYFKLHDIPS